jgi:signal transduction histidine kinase
MSTPAGRWSIESIEPRRDARRISARSAVGRVLRAPFTRQAWTDLGCMIVSFPLALGGFIFDVMQFAHPVLWVVCAPPVRGLGTANRWMALRLFGERIPPPPPMRVEPRVHAKATDAPRFASLVSAQGATVKLRPGRIEVRGMPAVRLAELAAQNGIAITDLKTHSGWFEAAARDKPAWRTRAYLALKLPVSLLGLLPWGGGLSFLAFSIWLALRDGPNFQPQVTPGQIVWSALAGGGLLLAAPWLTSAALAADRALMRGLLGPASLAERVRDLEVTRAHAVDDAAARLRSIERDLHDGAQAQLVGLAMKLGLAREKLSGGTQTGVDAADLDRAVELVDAAHRSAIEAITELRVLARGIHPPVLDNGLADALTTLATRSAVPVDVVTDIGGRPSAAIETIAYFCAAELLANVAKHSGARRAVLEAVHVPGLLRLRVVDDGRGGATPEAGGGLLGLADRIRTVDGAMEVSSPRGGPTVVTVELPSHA